MNATRLVRAALVLALVVPLAACPARDRPSGGTCEFNGDCVVPLVCAARVCRAQCMTDRDCTNGYRCVVARDQPDKNVCLPPDAPGYCEYASQCPRPLVCTADRRCAMQCVTDEDCRLGGYCGSCLDGGVCDFHPSVDAGERAPNRCDAAAD